MNPDRIVLETILQMREHLPQSLARTKPLGYGTRLPIPSLRTMCERFGTSWAAAFIFQRNGGLSPDRSQILGNSAYSHQEWTEEQIVNEFSTETKVLIPFEYTPSLRTRPIHFGYLALERNERFSRDELAALRHACSFAASYIYEMTESSYLEAMRRFQSEISQYGQLQSGTWIFRVLKRLHRCTRAHVVAYATISSSDICIEYSSSGTNHGDKIAPRLMHSALPDVLKSTIIRRDVSAWTDLEDRVLTDFVSTALNWTVDSSKFYLAVQKAINEPIGLWIVGFRGNRFHLDHPCRELLQDVIRHASTRAVHLFQRRFNKLIVDPIFRGRDTRVRDSLLFALMPFTEPWSDRIWERMIKPIAVECGLTPKRADDLFGRDIMEDIWASILAAQVIVADITSRNANVFYELGIAHTLGKPVVLLTQSVEDIPFDLNRYRHIVYSDNLDGYDTLTKQLRSALQEFTSK